MAGPRSGQRGARGLRRLFAGGGLLGVGLVGGIVLGAVLDSPRVLLRRLREPVRVVALVGVESVADPEELIEFERLQAAAPRPPRDVAKPAPGRPSRAPAPEATPPPAPSPATPAPSRAELLQQIAGRVAPVAPDVAAAPQSESPPSRRDGATVQVASYAERAAADALALRLRRDGFDSYVSRAEVEGGERFRVRVQPGAGGDARALAAQLETRGFRPWVARE